MMTLKVNGRDHQIDADPDTPLLYVLRDDLKLNAAKFGCGLGQCGSCTVIVDGKAVLSCVTPLLLLEGKQVTTLEGLGTIEAPAPIQRAFMEEQAAQCGYCIAGMMMRAQALLQRNSKPTDEQIRAELEPQSVPLRHPYAHPARGASRRQADGYAPTRLRPVRGARNERPRDSRPPPRARGRRRVDRQLLARRRLCAGSGAPAAAPAPKPPGSLDDAPYLDSWIRIDADGSITAFTGKAELGQGFKTAFQQIAAEELDVPFESLKVDHGRYRAAPPMKATPPAAIPCRTAAPRSRTPPRRCASLLVAEAARRLDLPAENFRTENGAVIAPDGQRFSYGELVAGDMLHVQAQPKSKLKDPATFKVMGQPVPRVDIPAKVTGGAAYVQDMRLPGMVHARIVRPPSYGAQLTECDTSAVEKMPGVVKVVRDGNFLARRRRKGIPGDQGDEGAVGGGEMEGDREPAEAGRSASRPDQPAVAGLDHLRAAAIRRRSARRPSRLPIRGPISRTARSGRPARSRNSSMAR